jgi:thiamine pyrophosphokinase
MHLQACGSQSAGGPDGGPLFCFQTQGRERAPQGRYAAFVVAGSPLARRPSGVSPGRDDYVIAADLGAHHALTWGWRIDLLVGDLDSLPAGEASRIEVAGTQIFRAPAAKDETDTELALARALMLEPAQIIICAATGGRTDHLLANVLLLARPALATMDVQLVDGGETLRLLHAEGQEARLGIEGAPGDLLSLLPLGGDAAGVSTEGLLYPLRAETLYLGQARGVSNVLTGARCEVSLQRGQLLVIHNRMEMR